MENSLPVYEKVMTEKAEKNVSVEAVLPEYLPNMARIVRVSVLPTLRETTVSENDVCVEGRVVFGVVYVCERGEKLKCAVFTGDFSQTFPCRSIAETLGEDGFVDCTLCASEEKAVLYSPRKAGLSCKLFIDLEATALRQNEVLSAKETEDVKKLTRDVPALCVRRLEKTQILLSEEIRLENGMSDAREVVFADGALCTENAYVRDGRCFYEGSVLVSCLYLSDAEGDAEYVSFSKKLPFTAQTAADGVPDDAFLLPCAALTSLSVEVLQDSYGENRVLSVSLDGTIRGKACFSVPATVCEDAFCLRHGSACEVRETPVDLLAAHFSETARVTETVRAPIGDMTDVVASSASGSLSSCEVADGRLVLHGRANVTLCGMTASGTLDSCSFSFPFAYSFPQTLPDAGDDGQLRFDACLSVCSCRCAIENGEVRCDLEIAATAAVFAREKIPAVTALDVDEASESTRDKSEYILYYPEPEESLWSICKHFLVSPDDLCAANGLESADAPRKKRALVIPR